MAKTNTREFLRERLKIRVAYEIISMAMMASGAGLLSFATSIWKNQPLAGVLLAFGSILVIGAIIARVAKIKS